MNKIFLSLATFLVAFSIQAQGPVRRVNTIAELQAIDPAAVSVGDALSYEVTGYTSSNKWDKPRVAHWNPSSAAAQDYISIFTTAGAGRWIFDDISQGTVNIRWANAYGDGVTDDTLAVTRSAAKLQALGRGVLKVPPGIYRVSTSGVVAIFTNMSSVKIDAEGSFITTDLSDSTFTSVTLTNLGLTATAVWAAPHNLAAGRAFVIKDSTDDAFNGTWTVATSNSPTVLTFALTTYATPSGPATAIAHDSDIGRALFRFDSCTNVDVGNLVFRGVEHPRDIQYRLGYRVIEVRKGSTKIRGDLTVSGASYGWYTGEYAVPSLGGCTDFDVRVWANSVGYPVSCAGSGHDSEFDIYSENVHRGGYFGGVKRSTARVWLKNFDVTGAILAHQLGPAADNFGCEDFTLRVYDTGTTEPIDLLGVGGTRYLATVSGYNSTNEVRHKNLDIRVYGRNLIQTSGLLVQTLSSNHWIDGLTFGGVLDQSGIANTNNRNPFYIYATTPADTAGQFQDISIRDWKYLGPSDSDMSKTAYVVLANAHNDVVFDGYETTGATTTVGLGDGFHRSTIPRFPDWTSASFEAAAGQKVSGGIKLAASKTIATLSSTLSSNDFTLQWVGEVPSGDAGLFVVTSGSSATAGSFGASITNSDLIVRQYGASAADWIGVKATNWASALRGDVVSLGVVKTSSGLELFTDGHSTQVESVTAGTAPAWTDAIAGQSAYVGIDNSSSSYSGQLYRFAIWNYDRSDDFPALATGWATAQDGPGEATQLMNPTTANGSFETLGAGGADVFASWTESTAGASTITVSTNAIQGTNSMMFTVDSSASFVGVTSSATMEPGADYTISFWARIAAGGTSGQIAILGAAGGDYPISISGTWAKYTVTKTWISTTFSIKRWSLTSQSAEIDDVQIRKSGSYTDFDWTRSPADFSSGKFSSIQGGAASTVAMRGPSVSDDRGNSDITLEPGFDAPIQLFATALSGPRTITLSTNKARRGDAFRIIRTGGGGGSLAFVSPSYSINTNTFADVVYSGTNWMIGAVGFLSPNATFSAITLNGETLTDFTGTGLLISGGALNVDSSYYLNRTNHFGTQSNTTITGLGSLSVLNTPATNNSLYGMSNGVWAIVPAAPAPVTYTFSTGLTNSGTTVYGNYFPGANIVATTNGTMVTFSANATVVNTNQVAQTYGELYAADNTVAQSITTSNTYNLLNYPSTFGRVSGITQTSTNRFTITQPGAYLATANLAFSGAANATVAVAIFTNAVECSWTEGERKLGTSGDVGSMSLGGILSLVSNDVVDLRVKTDNDNTSYTFRDANFRLALIASPTNTLGTYVYVDDVLGYAWNVVDSTEINPAASGTNLSFSIYNNSVTTNKIDSTFYNWVLSQAGGQVRVDGTTVTNIKTSSDIAFTTGSSEATPALTTTAVTPGSYSNATVTVDSKGRLTAASTTAQPQRTELAVDGDYKVSANLADSAMIAVTASGTNITMTIPDGVITTNKVDSTFYAQLTPYIGKAVWVANPNSVGTEVSSLAVKGVVSTVLFSQYTSSGGCVSYDEYDVQFSSNIGTNYTPIVIVEGSKSGIQPTGGAVQNDDSSSSISGTGFKVWRAHGVDEPCLDDGYRITILISNY